MNLGALLQVCRELPADERHVYRAMTGRPYQSDQVALECFTYLGPRWIAANNEGVPVAAGGFIRQRPGSFRTWFFATAECWQSHGKEITGLVKLAIAELPEARRIETLTLANRRDARLWYTRIGLKEEATHASYGADGEDVVVYVAVRKS